MDVLVDVQYPAQLVLQGRALREHVVSPVAPSGGFVGRSVEVDQFGHAAEFRQEFLDGQRVPAVGRLALQQRTKQ